MLYIGDADDTNSMFVYYVIHICHQSRILCAVGKPHTRTLIALAIA